MSATTLPRARYRDDGSVEIAFPYDPGLVASLKTIPAGCRRFSPATKIWTVEALYANDAVELLRFHFPDARVTGQDSRAEPAFSKGNERLYATLHLLPSAPAELIEASYRVLARLHHPDVGGDGEHMKRLNAARDALKELAL